MKIPKTTKEQPFIQFTFDKNGKMKLELTEGIGWGGKNGGFVTGGGAEGNCCLPKDLDTYIKAFKERKVKEIEKEINRLQKKLEIFKS